MRSISSMDHYYLVSNIQTFYSRLQNVQDREKGEYPGKFIPELRLIHTDMGGQTKVWITQLSNMLLLSSFHLLGVVSSIPV